jgi:hypothetical protein
VTQFEGSPLRQAIRMRSKRIHLALGLLLASGASLYFLYREAPNISPESAGTAKHGEAVMSARERHALMQRGANKPSAASNLPQKRKTVHLKQAGQVQQGDIFGSTGGDSIPEETAAALGLTDEQKVIWKDAMKVHRSQMTKLARKHLQKDTVNSTPDKDVYIVQPFQQEAAKLRDEFLDIIGTQLGTALSTKLSERYNWASYFGNYGQHQSILEFYEERLGERAFLRWKSTYTDPSTGQFVSSGVADFEDVLTHWGDLFETTEGDSRLGTVR